MKLGEFISSVNTTKETVRHYEDMNLLQPSWDQNRKVYTKKEIDDFQMIMDLKSMGFSLKDIQLMFDLKRAYGCGNEKLITDVMKQLNNHIDVLKKEEEEILQRRIKLEEEIKMIDSYMSNK
ncbi:MerR family transcriptional regulator [Cytobacillus sp. IB215316]|uniref:helix-turn-helix domain-containing protein n=1 Tax=Cytobacillus sp. IB215316 TaxID=3097354 RepID=UPI002A10B43B|nr:MerR family transcriptional regulator [Cytobacillus sp. IB215316]MDX8363033.1 MerR family transcriptional regulator [Cytobacillus sp. IB215316]